MYCDKAKNSHQIVSVIYICGIMVSLILESRFTSATEPQYKPIPVMQAVPLPDAMISFLRGEKEIACFHYGDELRRPFVYPIIGPSGRTLTRMGHPHDPYSHSHHNSVWTSHNDVEGINFWLDNGKDCGRIVTHHVIAIEDGNKSASVTVLNNWIGPDGTVVMDEFRRVEVLDLDGRQWMMIIDLQFEVPANRETVTINSNPFGVIGVRMAKWIGVNDGGGSIRNSEGQEGEQGANGVFRKPARWCDYSGQVVQGVVEGLTLLDHPSNINHPAPFHVRNDGWMGACLTLDKAITISKDKPLRLRYGLLVHDGMPDREKLENYWKDFASNEIVEIKRK